MFFMFFFICKLMFLTSMIFDNCLLANQHIWHTLRVCQWKNFQNRSISDEDTNYDMASTFC